MRRHSWRQRRLRYLLHGSIFFSTLIGGMVGTMAVPLAYLAMVVAGFLVWISLPAWRERRRGFEVIIPRR
jgi:hypothetical protein